MTAIVDAGLCTGCGLCADICPQVFEITGDVAKVIVGSVPVEEENACRDAAERCPVEAISLKQ